MSTYDLTPYVATAPPPPPPPRSLWCDVTLTMRSGEVRSEGGAFLHWHHGCTGPSLSLGILQAVAAYLRVDEPDGRHAAQIIHEIERQLEQRPYALLHCPEGELRVALVPAP